MWEYSIPERTERVRVLVLSTDSYNQEPRAKPVCADVVRRIAGVSSPLLVPLADPDPIGGVVDLASLRPCDRRRMTGPVCMLTGVTMSRIAAGLSAFVME